MSARTNVYLKRYMSMSTLISGPGQGVGASKYITINPTLLHHQWLVVVLFSLASIWHPPSPGMRMMGWRRASLYDSGFTGENKINKKRIKSKKDSANNRMIILIKAARE